MTRRSDLREEVFARARGRCEWSLCTSRADHLAHIRGLGRGGNPDGTRDVPENTMALCQFHHDLLDGRRMMKLWEVESLLLELNARRHPEREHVVDSGSWPI